MKPRLKKAWIPALGLTLALSTVGGIALGAGADDWYDGDNATVPDLDRTAVALKLYSATGAEVTSGSTTTPLAAFGAAGDTVRAGDEYASLFVHLPQTGTAPGAWPGVQATGTDRFAGAGAVSAPAALSGRPFVRTTADGYTLADVVSALPNPETSASFAGVYELRLRTSSATRGVGSQYAAAYLKVTGSTWQVTTAPVLGDEEEPTPTPTPTTDPDPVPVGTSVAAGWPATLTYGTAGTVTVTVSAATGTARPSGSVRLLAGTETLGTAALSAGGTASLALPATLAPGPRSFQVVYDGAARAFTASASAVRAITIARATVSGVSLKVTKKPSAKKAGAALVTVTTPAGLAPAGGKGTLTLAQGKTVKKVAVRLKGGTATVKLKKLPKGAWKLTFSWPGDASYLAATSKTVKVRSK